MVVSLCLSLDEQGPECTRTTATLNAGGSGYRRWVLCSEGAPSGRCPTLHLFIPSPQPTSWRRSFRVWPSEGLPKLRPTRNLSSDDHSRVRGEKTLIGILFLLQCHCFLPPSHRAFTCAVCWITQGTNAKSRRGRLIEKSEKQTFFLLLLFFMKQFWFCFWFVHEPRYPVTNRKPPSSWCRARLSLSTTDSTRIHWARGSLPFPASPALSPPPNPLCFQDIILLTHYPRHPRADCRQDEAFSKVRGLHFSESRRWLVSFSRRICLWGNSRCAFSSCNRLPERTRLPQILVRLWTSAANGAGLAPQ